MPRKKKVQLPDNELTAIEFLKLLSLNQRYFYVVRRLYDNDLKKSINDWFDTFTNDRIIDDSIITKDFLINKFK